MIVNYDEKYAEKLQEMTEHLKKRYRLNEEEAPKVARIVLLEIAAKEVGARSDLYDVEEPTKQKSKRYLDWIFART